MSGILAEETIPVASANIEIYAVLSTSSSANAVLTVDYELVGCTSDLDHANTVISNAKGPITISADNCYEVDGPFRVISDNIDDDVYAHITFNNERYLTKISDQQSLNIPKADDLVQHELEVEYISVCGNTSSSGISSYTKHIITDPIFSTVPLPLPPATVVESVGVDQYKITGTKTITLSAPSYLP